MAESQIDMTPECLVGWRVFRKPGNVTEDGVPAACDEIRKLAISNPQLANKVIKQVD